MGMLDFLRRNPPSEQRDYCFFECSVVVLTVNKEVKVVITKMRKNLETNEIEIERNSKWKKIDEVFGGRSLERIRKKAENYAQKAKEQ